MHLVDGRTHFENRRGLDRLCRERQFRKVQLVFSHFGIEDCKKWQKMTKNDQKKCQISIELRSKTGFGPQKVSFSIGQSLRNRGETCHFWVRKRWFLSIPSSETEFSGPPIEKEPFWTGSLAARKQSKTRFCLLSWVFQSIGPLKTVLTTQSRCFFVHINPTGLDNFPQNPFVFWLESCKIEVLRVPKRPISTSKTGFLDWFDLFQLIGSNFQSFQSSKVQSDWSNQSIQSIQSIRKSIENWLELQLIGTLELTKSGPKMTIRRGPKKVTFSINPINQFVNCQSNQSIFNQFESIVSINWNRVFQSIESSKFQSNFPIGLNQTFQFNKIENFNPQKLIKIDDYKIETLKIEIEIEIEIEFENGIEFQCNWQTCDMGFLFQLITFVSLNMTLRLNWSI